MQKSLGSLVIGVTFIACGLVWLVSNLVPGINIDIGVFWPVFLLLPGVFFWARWFTAQDRRKEWGLVIPATILTGLSLTFFLNMFVSQLGYGEIWAWTAFMYPGVVSMSFIVAWAAAGREKTLLIPAVILFFVSLLVLCSTTATLTVASIGSVSLTNFTWPMLFVCVGIFIISAPIWAAIFEKDGRFFGKTEQEWKNWGTDFGKQMEGIGKDIERSVTEAVEIKDDEEKEGDVG